MRPWSIIETPFEPCPWWQWLGAALFVRRLRTQLASAPGNPWTVHEGMKNESEERTWLVLANSSST